MVGVQKVRERRSIESTACSCRQGPMQFNFSRTQIQARRSEQRGTCQSSVLLVEDESRICISTIQTTTNSTPLTSFGLMFVCLLVWLSLKVVDFAVEVGVVVVAVPCS